MKELKAIPFLVIFCTILVPLAFFRIAQESGSTSAMSVTEKETITTESGVRLAIPVLFSDGVVSEMELEEYVTAVVLREMPADFEIEALKAQAVVARTYALRRHLRGGKHENATVCTDPSCCQGYYSPSEYLKNGGADDMLEKVNRAVTDTQGRVLTYNDELVEATYFSCSGGQTEDAKAVWGTDIPYLQSTESPGEENATHFTDTVVYTSSEFQQLLGRQLQGLPGSWFGSISYTNGGGVDTIEICGKVYHGTELRKYLGLRSTAFLISAVGNSITITTKGFGHRVGMSQYGADVMAVDGYSYAEILAHYYTGTELKCIIN